MQRKNLLITLGVVVAVFVLPNLDRLQNKARQTIASAAGKAAVTNMSGVVAENNARGLAAAQLITLPIAVSEVAPGIFQASGVGNSFAIKTNEGSVIFDTGLIIQASNQIAKLKAAVGEEEPKKIILSHSHADHVGGTRLWDQGSAEIVAHEAFEEEQRYLTELNPYLHQRNRTLFPWIPETPRTLQTTSSYGYPTKRYCSRVTSSDPSSRNSRMCSLCGARKFASPSSTSIRLTAS